MVLGKLQLRVWTLTESANFQVEWMLLHKADLTPFNHKIQQLMEPRVPWEAVEYNKTLLSLFEPRNIKKVKYDEDDQSDITDDVDGDGEDDEEETIYDKEDD